MNASTIWASTAAISAVELAPGRANVVELALEEGAPVDERGELLGGERVDRAERGELPLELPHPLAGVDPGRQRWHLGGDRLVGDDVELPPQLADRRLGADPRLGPFDLQPLAAFPVDGDRVLQLLALVPGRTEAGEPLLARLDAAVTLGAGGRDPPVEPVPEGPERPRQALERAVVHGPGRLAGLAGFPRLELVGELGATRRQERHPLVERGRAHLELAAAVAEGPLGLGDLAACRGHLADERELGLLGPLRRGELVLGFGEGLRRLLVGRGDRRLRGDCGGLLLGDEPELADEFGADQLVALLPADQPVDPAPRLLGRDARLRELAARAIGARRRPVGRRDRVGLCLAGPLEGGPRRPGVPCPDPPSERREPVPLGRDDGAARIGEGAFDHGVGSGAHDLDVADEPVEQSGDGGVGGTNRVPQRLGPRRQRPFRRLRAVGQEREDVAAGSGLPQLAEGGTRRRSPGDEDGVEHAGDRRLEGEDEVVVDLDDVEQRADDARDGGEPFDPCPGAGVVEGELERLDPGRRRLAARRAHLQRLVGLREEELARGLGALGGLGRARRLVDLGGEPVELRRRDLETTLELVALPGERGDPFGGAHLGLAARAQDVRRDVAGPAHLRGRGERRRFVGPDPLLGGGPAPGERLLLGLERAELRGKDPLLRLGVGERRHDPVEVGGDVGRRGRTLEHGRERGAGTPAFVHERELAVHALAQLLEPADDRHELVGPRRPELALDRRQTAV